MIDPKDFSKKLQERLSVYLSIADLKLAGNKTSAWPLNAWARFIDWARTTTQDLSYDDEMGLFELMKKDAGKSSFDYANLAIAAPSLEEQEKLLPDFFKSVECGESLGRFVSHASEKWLDPKHPDSQHKKLIAKAKKHNHELSSFFDGFEYFEPPCVEEEDIDDFRLRFLYLFIAKAKGEMYTFFLTRSRLQEINKAHINFHADILLELVNERIHEVLRKDVGLEPRPKRRHPARK
ncbi:MAG: hypothetical protein WCJ29_02980 [bacterium]